MVKKQCYTKKTKAGANYTTCLESQTKPKTIKITRKKKKVVKKVVAPKAGKKQCYTKKTKAGANYTTCVESQSKPKTTAKGIKTIQKKIKTTRKLTNKSTIKPPLAKSKVKPKSTREKKMSAGKSVLFTSGLMAKIGAAVITKPEKARRERRKIVDSFFNASKKNRLRGMALLADLKKRKNLNVEGPERNKAKAEIKEWLSSRTVINKMYKRDKKYVKDTNGIKWRTALGKRLNSVLPPTTKSKEVDMKKRLTALKRQWDKISWGEKHVRWNHSFFRFVETKQSSWFIYNPTAAARRDGTPIYTKKVGVPYLGYE